MGEADILDGREERFRLQKEALAKYRCPVVTATVNYPGPIKNDPVSGVIFDEMVSVVKLLPIATAITGSNGAGAFLLAPITVSAAEFKKKAVEIEKNHSLGRLFDIDVIDYPYRKISRTELGNEVRSCLICNDDVRICAREGRHTVAELLEKIRQMVEVYLFEKNRKRTGGADQ